jgi:Arc/MetJ-type ribon-helix-helix transcriptional regulator
MVKTTVYLPESQADALRRLAESTGRSQAELIREAIETKTAAAAVPTKRRFHSAGVGHGGGEPVAENAREILRREMGRSRR